MVKRTGCNGNIVFVERHGASIVHQYNMRPNICSAGALRPNPGRLLFVGAKLHICGTCLKNPDEVTSGIGGMHDWNAHNRTRVAVVP